MTRAIRGEWQPHEDAVIIAGISKGKIWKDVAAELPGRTERTARMRAQRMGVFPRRKIKCEDIVTQEADSARLLHAMERQFAMASRKWGVDYLDARTLLMNATSL